MSNPLLIVPIRKFSIAYDLRRASMNIWAVGCFDTLFKSAESVHKFVLIAVATLLNCFNLHCLLIFQIKEHKGKKYRTTVPS